MAESGCWYCEGARALCTCTEDCGARPDGTLTGNSHVCGKAPADDIAAWLRSTGLYSEEEIAGWISARDDDG